MTRPRDHDEDPRHRARQRHRSADELAADYLRHHPNEDLDRVSVQQLLNWSGSRLQASAGDGDGDGDRGGETGDER